MKIAVVPTWVREDKGDGGIRRVSEAQWKHLPEFGIEPTKDVDSADLIAVHGTQWEGRPGVPTVHHGHGLYWDSYDWPDWGHYANRQVAESMVRSFAHTAPSEWVARALRRGGLFYPEVIHHGTDTDLWVPPADAEGRDFVLWNKARSDPVSDPEDMQRLAKHLPDVPFRTTIGKQSGNVRVIGTMPVGKMVEWVQHAGVYLATARETFGIGTIEALSCGVPVVGWGWGGQLEIVRHGETGFLAEPGDYEALAEGVRWALANREQLSEAARADAVERWGWRDKIGQYADFYRRTLARWERPEVKVSVITTVHNRTDYLEDAVRSVQAQTMTDFEHLIVDDASDDGETPDLVTRLAGAYESVVTVRTPENLGLSGARNFGFRHARGRYVIYLDDDDQLEKHALALLSETLDADPGIHIAYGHLDTVDESGENRERNDWPWPEFKWGAQMAHLNQLPYASMMRREVIERSGGYRLRAWRAEDAEHWCRVTSLGFRAKKVTERSTLVYRMHDGQKSRGESGDGDWTAWFPWRIGPSTPKEGMTALRRGRLQPDPDKVPWSAQGDPPKGVRFWPVPDRHDPQVSVVIPVGPGHEQYVIDALDSLVAQTYGRWEAIVVNATGEAWGDGFASPVAGAPYAKVIVPVDGKKLRPAEARNLGAEHARAPSLLFLDADDLLLPHALEEMIRLHIGTEGGLVYTDWLRSDGDPELPMKMYETWDFECGDVLKKMRHAVTCMIPRWAHEKVGGFDESFEGWEDWDYFIALQAAGVCSYRVDRPCFVYRFRHGTIREDSFGKREQILKRIREKWSDYYEGRKVMGCGKCPSPRKAALPSDSSSPQASPQRQSASGVEDPVLLEYQGPGEGKRQIRGPATGTVYIFHQGSQKYVHAEDARVFLQRTRGGVPDFLRVGGSVDGSEPAEAPTEAFGGQVEESEAAQPDFPEMDTPEESETRDVSEMTVAELREAVVDAEDRTLIQWLQDEREGKQRVTAIDAIESALEREPA